MSDILNADKALVIPSGNGTNSPIVLDMRNIYKTEARLFEIQSLTKAKSSEFLYVVIQALSETKRHMATINLELLRAKQELRKVRAIIILDEVPEVLKAMGGTSSKSPMGSEDFRESLVNKSQQYQVVTDRVYQINASLEIMEAKAESFKMSYFVAMNVARGVDVAANISGGVDGEDPGSYSEQEKAQNFVNKVNKPTNGFGNAKF